MFASILSKNRKAGHFRRFYRNKCGLFSVSEEIRFGLEYNKPIVALESTIITHGMPYPDNVKCALEVEDVVRKQGAIPATVAILNGQISVGLTPTEINQLGDVSVTKPIKTSRRDLFYVVAHKLNGGTTVSGTLIAANHVGLPIFATGGIGGVHRNAETTLDVSADLVELGRSRVAVISSGVKSILDIPKTLEFLETQGVFVATFADTTDFPAFYARRSGHHVPYKVQSADEAAEIIRSSRDLRLGSGMLFGVPVPEPHSIAEERINAAIDEALAEAKAEGVHGKQITPFLLGRIAKITHGQSLQTNIALIKNNAKTAADIAVALARLTSQKQEDMNDGGKEAGRPVVIGGSNLDCSIKLEEAEIQMDGRMHYGKFSFGAGGVGRNITEALTKLGCTPIFISALGKDPQGAIIKEIMPNENLANVRFVDANTGTCAIIMDATGDCKFLIGDMSIHKEITPQMIVENEAAIAKAPLIVFDSNLSIDTIDSILLLANQHNIPVLFEPTDLIVASKPFESKHWRAIKIITPNLNELRDIASCFGIVSQSNTDDVFGEIADVTSRLVEHIDNIIVTLGADGLIVARKAAATDRFLSVKIGNCEVSVRHYPVCEIENFVNVNGAGDSLASGMIFAILKGLSEEQCVSVGIEAAKTALSSPTTVAKQLFSTDHVAWRSKALYKTLL